MMRTNSMGDEERLEDEELTAFTDALLAGQVGEHSDRPLLAGTVETLARVMRYQAPPGSLRRRVLQCVKGEWVGQRLSFGQRLLGLFGRPRQRWGWAVVAALVLISVAVALFVPTGALEVTGTVTGEAGVIAVVVVALVLVGVIVLAWFASRR